MDQPGEVPQPPGPQADQAGGGAVQEILQPRGREILQAMSWHREMLQEGVLLLRYEMKENVNHILLILESGQITKVIRKYII